MVDEYTAGMWIDTNIDNSFRNQLQELAEFCRGSGTLGCFALNSEGKPVLLSCQHVLFPNDLAPDKAATFQPRYSCCCGGDQIAKQWIDKAKFKNGRYLGGYKIPPDSATVKVIYHGVITVWEGVPNGFQPTVTDCAMAVLTRPGMKFRNVWKYKVDGQVVEIPLNGFHVETSRQDYGVKKGPPLGTLPTPAQYVRVYSEQLGRVVYGTVLDMHGTGVSESEDPEGFLYPNGIGNPDEAPPICRQLMFLPRPDPDPSKPTVELAYKNWSGRGPDHGDSGTMVINDKNMIVGMITTAVTPAEIFGEDNVRSEWELLNVKTIALFTPIRDIVELLKVTIPASPKPWAGSVPAHGSNVLEMNGRKEQALRESGFARLRDGLRRSRRGRLFLGKIGVHGRELRFMFERVRELSVSWNHLNGPAFVHHASQSICDPEHIFPRTINGVSREDLILTILPIVERHASPQLRRDLARHGGWIEQSLLSVQTADEFVDDVANT